MAAATSACAGGATPTVKDDTHLSLQDKLLKIAEGIISKLPLECERAFFIKKVEALRPLDDSLEEETAPPSPIRAPALERAGVYVIHDLADAGHFDEAIEQAKGIENPNFRWGALTYVAQQMLENKPIDEALEVVGADTSKVRRCRLEKAIMERGSRFARSENLDEAKLYLSHLTCPEFKLMLEAEIYSTSHLQGESEALEHLASLKPASLAEHQAVLLAYARAQLYKEAVDLVTGHENLKHTLLALIALAEVVEGVSLDVLNEGA